MVTIGPVLRRILFPAMAFALAAPGGAAAGGLRAPVAYYDAGAVLLGTVSFAGERERFTRLADGYEAETAPLQRAVHRLRDAVLRGRGLPDGERRELEARLAQATIALLVARTEGARELARELAELLERLEHSVVPAVARVAREHGLAVVIRTDEATAVLDEDALDVTALVIDTLDGTRAAPERPSPGERRRTRLQSCEAASPDVLAAGD